MKLYNPAFADHVPGLSGVQFATAEPREMANLLINTNAALREAGLNIAPNKITPDAIIVIPTKDDEDRDYWALIVVNGDVTGVISAPSQEI
jgi:hypothetical protein